MPQCILEPYRAPRVTALSWKWHDQQTSDVVSFLLTPNPGARRVSLWRLESLEGHLSTVGW